jgi:colanic acid/amylovoran biosynthesis glycosyltransferase
VLHSVPGTWLPQTETWLHNQVRFLPAWIESHVMCAGSENLDQFPVDRLHCGPPGGRRGRGRRRRLPVKPDVVHSHFGPEGWRNLRVAPKHVVSFYGYDLSWLPANCPKWRRRYRRLFRGADLFLCEGEHMAGRLIELGCPETKVRVHRLGIDLSAIPCSPRAWNRRGPLRVLLAASFRPKKGLPDAIEALGRLRRETELRITIIGDATAARGSTEEKQRILAAIDRHGLRDRVTMLGFQPHRVLLEQAADHHMFLAPSVTAADGDTEGGAPVALIEMAASGMAVVSTFHCDIPGVVRHGVTGFLAREGDIEDLVHQVRRAMALSDHWPAMARAARRWIAEHFDAVNQGYRLAATYAEAVTGWRYHPASVTETDTTRTAAA